MPPLDDIFIYCDVAQFHAEDNHVQLHSVQARDFGITPSTLKNYAAKVGIPRDIDVRAAPNQLDSSLSGLSEAAQDSISRTGSVVDPNQQFVSDNDSDSESEDESKQG